MKILLKIAVVIGIMLSNVGKAQITETFDTFTLTPNFFYQDNNGTDWRSSLTKPIAFEYGWKNGAWSSGTVYTNIKDTTDLTLSNIYASCTYTAYDGSNYATVKDSAVIYLENSPSFLNKVSGFFVTNTAYVKNILKNGNANCRKFGDTTGTGWGNSTAQGAYPDWYKLTVYGYKNGIQNPNFVEFYLADYRLNGTANDYIVSNWRYVNCISIGFVDSLKIIMRSNDVYINGKMKTPGYFSIDHFTTTNNVGINELENATNITISPNPTTQNITINYSLLSDISLNIKVIDISGKEVITTQTSTQTGNNTLQLTTQNLEAGIYFLNISDGQSSKNIKFIKL